MMSLNVLYVATVVVYCLSILGYFIDFSYNNQKVNKASFWLLSIVWILQTIFFVFRVIELDYFPLITSFESFVFYAWIIVSASLLMNWFLKIDFIVFFINIIGFALMMVSFFLPSKGVTNTVQNMLIGDLLIIHVSLILISYGMFLIAFIFSMMYYIQHQILKRKKWGRKLRRFGDLSQYETLSFLFTTIAFPLLLMGLILGLLWTKITLENIPWFDAKIIGTFIVLFIYGYYLYQRGVKKMCGLSFILLNIASFLVLLINYFLASTLSTFHT